MSPVIGHLKRFLSALLALGLLATPCLSVVGPIGSGKAFAYHSDQNHGQPAAQQQRFGGHDYATHGATQPAAPDTDFATCCCPCDRWISKSAVSEVGAGKRATEPPTTDNAKTADLVAMAPFSGLPPDRWRPSGPALDPAGRKNAPLYAFTGRIRL
jgi:hypothetical protein